MSFWRRPGKNHGISATLNYGGYGCFYVFTTSGYPFEPNEPYNPFAIYSVLRHHGDFSAAAKALRLDGYGTPMPKAPTTQGLESPPPVKHRALTSAEQDRIIEQKMSRVARFARGLNAAAYGVEPEDLVGEAYMHLVEAVRSYRQERACLDDNRLTDHVDRHVRSRLYDYWDAVKAKKRRSGSSLPPPSRSTAGLLPNSSRNDLWTDRLSLKMAISRLPHLERLVIVMGFFGRYSDAEIAEEAGVPVHTVRYRRNKALAQLRKDLA
jgi:RNA polymerase sigma factor (sigma-70 family)